MKKIIPVILALSLMTGSLSLSVCAEGVEEKASAFTANIDKYWQEHDIDGAMAASGNSDEVLDEGKAKMLELYGENKEITGEYDEALAAKTVSGTYVGKVVSDAVV